MKIKFAAVATLFSLAILAAGCFTTPDNNTKPGVPFVKDTIESLYEKPSEQVYMAARDVIQFKGTLVKETTLPQTNAVNRISKIVEGKVNSTRVWVTVEQKDVKTSSVAVKTRTSSGVGDVDLAAQIDKEIALKLVR